MWWKQVHTLTTLEVMHTYGFWKIMSYIWIIPILYIAAILIYKRLKQA